MSEIYKLSGFQQELYKAERFFSMHLTRQELKSRLDEIERLNNIINKAIDILDIYGTSNYETADLLYSILRGVDKE